MEKPGYKCRKRKAEKAFKKGMRERESRKFPG